MAVQVVSVDFSLPRHREDLVLLLDLYSQDEMGSGAPLPDDVRAVLAERLAEIPHCRAWLAYDESTPVGVIVAFLGFSTFRARPLLNLHDVAVRPGYRGRGIGQALMTAAEEGARALGCCKVTLEVRVDNDAQRLYHRQGYRNDAPQHEFWAKVL